MSAVSPEETLGSSAAFIGEGGSGLSLQVQTNPAETLEADVQATLKLGFTLHRRMTAKSPFMTFVFWLPSEYQLPLCVKSNGLQNAEV